MNSPTCASLTSIAFHRVKAMLDEYPWIANCCLQRAGRVYRIASLATDDGWEQLTLTHSLKPFILTWMPVSQAWLLTGIGSSTNGDVWAHLGILEAGDGSCT